MGDDAVPGPMPCTALSETAVPMRRELNERMSAWAQALDLGRDLNARP